MNVIKAIINWLLTSPKIHISAFVNVYNIYIVTLLHYICMVRNNKIDEYLMLLRCKSSEKTERKVCSMFDLFTVFKK